MNIFQLISIILEIGVTIIALMIALKKKKAYGWFIALTFIIYVFYDSMKLMNHWNIEGIVLSVMFFVATVSIFTAVWFIYREN